MSNLRVIVTYRPGSKGDLLCNFLTDSLNFGKNGRNETNESAVPLRNLDRFFSNLSKDDLIKKAEDQIENVPFLVTNSHKLDSYPEEFLKKMKDCYKMIFIDASDFVTNVRIDEVLKRFDDKITSKDDRIFALAKGFKDFKISYKIDLDMLLRGFYDLSNKGRADYVRKMISTINVESLSINKSNERYFDILKYEDLFLPPYNATTEILDFLGQTDKIKHWKEEVIKSYLPKEVDVFGEIVYPADYGYEWHYEKEE